MSVKIKEVDENLFDDEIHLCLPPKDSPEHAAFQNGIKEKQKWLEQRLTELGSVAQIAYHKNQPVAFIEYVSAENAPVPIGEERKTALITCINKPKFQNKGIGTMLIQATLNRLRQLRVEHTKTLVARSPKWISGRVYFKNGFQIEKTFYKPENAEPLDLLTLNLKNPQVKTNETATIRFMPSVNNALPVHVVCFGSGQCPFNSLVCARTRKALERFDPRHVVLEILDSWENYKLARECGTMYSDLLINGKASFLGPPSLERIEEEIRKEIERTKLPMSLHLETTNIKSQQQAEL